MPKGKIKALIVEFQKLRSVKNMSMLGEKLSLKSIIMSYMPQDFHSSPYWSDTLSSHCKYSWLGLGQPQSSFGWQEIENQSLVIGSLNPSERIKDSVTCENREGLVQRGPKIYVHWAWSYGIMLLAPGSSSKEESPAGRDEDAIWVEVGLPVRALKALIDCWILLANCYGESANKRIKELLELDEDELSNGTQMACNTLIVSLYT